MSEIGNAERGAVKSAALVFGCSIKEYDESVLATRRLMGLPPDELISGQYFVTIDEDIARQTQQFEHNITPGVEVPLGAPRTAEERASLCITRNARWFRDNRKLPCKCGRVIYRIDKSRR